MAEVELMEVEGGCTQGEIESEAKLEIALLIKC